MPPKKTAQEAFIEQTYGSLDKAREADRAADALEAKANQPIDIFAKLGRTFGDNSIQDKISFPTRNPVIKSDNSQYKSHYKNYDHSLERVREIINHEKDIYANSGELSGGDVEWGDMHDRSVGNWEIDT